MARDITERRNAEERLQNLNDELEDFKSNSDYKLALRPYTFCHYVAASRQRGDILLGTPDKLGCSNAKYVFGWKELDDAEIKKNADFTFIDLFAGIGGIK